MLGLKLNHVSKRGHCLNFISILDTCTFYGNQYWYHHTIKALNNTADQAAQGALNKFEN